MQVDIIPLRGGIDQVTPPASLKAGELLYAFNFEPDINGGYRRISGMERLDGRPRPSDALYQIAAVVLTSAVAVGDTVAGVTSSATAVVIQNNDDTELITTKLTGTFTDGEAIQVSGSPVGTLTNITGNAGETDVLHGLYLHLAANEYRKDIQKPTGSGPIRGAWEYKGDIYAFRNNVAGTACNMWKATASGWSAVIFGREIQFDAAVGEVYEGNTVTGLTSGAVGVVRRALLRTGTWTVSGVGTLVFDVITGAFQDNEALQVGGVTKVTADGADTAITLLPGGRYVFDNYNFTAAADNLRAYFVDGVNEIHEFDGTRIVPIRTGLSTDKPRFIVGHQKHLIIAVKGSLQVSSIGNPYGWTALTGAAELGLGDLCTGLLRETGDAGGGVLYATTKRSIFMLHGNSAADFRLVEHSSNTGGREYTLQHLGLAYLLNATGVTTVQSSDRFGGFEFTTSTRRVQRFMDQNRSLETASLVLKSKNQYKLFFSNGDVLVLHARPSRNGFDMEPTFLNYGEDISAFTAFSYVADDGVERSFIGGADGHVYELDRGTSLDGQPLPYSLATTFNFQRKYRERKRYKRVVLQLATEGALTLQAGYELSFAGTDPSSPILVDKTTGAKGGFWDSFIWDAFTWDASGVQEINLDTPGVGTSLSIVISGQSMQDAPFLIHTAMIYHLPGRIER